MLVPRPRASWPHPRPFYLSPWPLGSLLLSLEVQMAQTKPSPLAVSGGLVLHPWLIQQSDQHSEGDQERVREF